MPQPLEDISALTIGMWPMAALQNDPTTTDKPVERVDAPILPDRVRPLWPSADGDAGPMAEPRIAHRRISNQRPLCERAGHLSTGTACPALTNRHLSGGARG